MNRISNIPKIIHYCWFGEKKIPLKEKKCIESWKSFFPDYNYMFWNENNFDLSENEFVKQAYAEKHYAFVSDYVRTKVLLEYGGIYFDTDVEVIKSLDNIINKGHCFLGFETRAHVGTAIMGFIPNHKLMKGFMTYYQVNIFKKNNGDINNIANVIVLTDLLIGNGLMPNGSLQYIDDICIYPRELFYPKKINETEFIIAEDTLAIHKCSNSWMTDKERRRGNNKVWINIMRPILRSIRSFGLKVLSKERIIDIEIKIRNILK